MRAMGLTLRPQVLLRGLELLSVLLMVCDLTMGCEPLGCFSEPSPAMKWAEVPGGQSGQQKAFECHLQLDFQLGCCEQSSPRHG